VRRLFAAPTEVVFGPESGREALYRFVRGLALVLRRFPQGNVAVVTHGTVLTLFVTSRAALDPWEFWRRLHQPAYVVFDLPSLTLAEAAFTV
jgi:broad specificity phosphatase PhoE